ncbi:atherin-like [Amblyraja radiata]|uniref:atherin-like n=1 Tax=Amblyraja radiata TaxID=386614 RepID=UPI001403AA45|nr:atherin-like [Amblyraja radiata]
MSEAECRRWISEAIEWLRARKARPDQERICAMVQRRHGVSPGRTRRQLERLLRSRALLRVRYKGSHSYRNASPGSGPGAGPEPEPGPSGGSSSPATRDRDRDRDRPRPPPPSVVLTRARHKEQQVARARGGGGGDSSSNSPAPEAEGKRRLTPTDSGPERKKTRRTKEAEPSDSEGSDEEKAAATKDVELRRQVPREAQNDVETASDGGSEEGEESPAKSPAVEDTGEELSSEEQLEVPTAAGQGPSQSPGHETKDVTGAEPGQEAEEQERGQVDLSPNIVGETSSSDVSVPVEGACGDPHVQEPGIHQGEAGVDGGTFDQLSLADRDTEAVPQCMDNRHPAARDQGTCHQPEPQTSEAVPEVGGASCLLTPSASPVEMVPEENGPTDRHLLEEEGKSVDPTEWSIVDVVNYFKAAGFPEQAVAFEDQEIDGKSLLLMKRNDVLTGLAIKLGPALKIYEFHIKVLQLHHFNNEAPSC